MLKAFLEYINTHRLFTKDDKLLAAVSGGVDSMVLVDLLQRAGFPFEMAHVNYTLRGGESEEDEAFLRAYAGEHNLILHVKRADTKAYAQQAKQSIQEAAREIRYEWLKQVGRERNCRYILTAHHKNDVAETVLFNLTRGSGLAGLHGILPLREMIARPLLFAARNEILAYAKNKNIRWREDRSNAEMKYARNRIRHRVLPELEKINPNVVNNIFNTTLRIQEVEVLLRQQVDELKSLIVSQDAGETRIDLAMLKKTASPATLLYLLIKEEGFNSSQVQDILSSQSSGKVFLSDKKRAVIHGETLLITPFAEDYGSSYLIEEWAGGPVVAGGQRFEFRHIEYSGQAIPEEEDVVWLDAGKLTFPLYLRKRRPGDKFHPLGMGGKTKKVKDFLTDLKLSLPQKEKIWILENGTGEIIWIAGLRMDERFKVNASTRKVFEMRMAEQIA